MCNSGHVGSRNSRSAGRRVTCHARQLVVPRSLREQGDLCILTLPETEGKKLKLVRQRFIKSVTEYQF